MKVKLERTLQIRDLNVKVTFEMEGDKKSRLPLTDEEMKGKMINIKV